MKRVTGITVVEMLVALTVIAIIAVITYALIGRARNATDIATCMSKLSRLNLALQAYRAEYGSAGSSVGTPVQLGLPRSIFEFRTYRRVLLEDIVEVATCPRATLRLGSEPQPVSLIYAYTPETIPLLGTANWDFAIEALRDELPILYCAFHNAPGHDVRNPSATHELQLLTLGGSVRFERISGLALWPMDLATYAKIKTMQGER